MIKFFTDKRRPKRNTLVMAFKVAGRQVGYYAPARVLGNDRHRTLVQFADGEQVRLMPALIKAK